jgi:hypothetical protein
MKRCGISEDNSQQDIFIDKDSKQISIPRHLIFLKSNTKEIPHYFSKIKEDNDTIFLNFYNLVTIKRHFKGLKD